MATESEYPPLTFVEAARAMKQLGEAFKKHGRTIALTTMAMREEAGTTPRVAASWEVERESFMRGFDGP